MGWGRGARVFLERWLRDEAIRGRERMPEQTGGRSQWPGGKMDRQYLVSAAWSGWLSGRGAGSVGSGSSY